MSHSYEDLKGMRVAELREVAKDIDHEAVHGYSTMHKEELLHAVCVALGLPEQVHHEVKGIDKRAVKAKIKALKERRAEALEAKDRQQLKRVRRRIHRLKRRIRRATL